MLCVVICGVDIGLSGQAWRCLDVASVAITDRYLGVSCMDNTTAESAANGIGSLAGIKSKNSILMVMNYTFIIAL
jgi:hypothetical protein